MKLLYRGIFVTSCLLCLNKVIKGGAPMYMQRNVTDKFIGIVVSCDIISTGSWYGDLPESVPKEVKLNRKDYYIEEIQHISIKEAISVTYGIKWEHISKPVEGKIESLTTKDYSIDESKKTISIRAYGA